MKSIRHNILPNGTQNGGLGYKIKTEALKNSLQKIQNDFPDRQWIIEQGWVTAASWDIGNDGYKCFFIAEVVAE